VIAQMRCQDQQFICKRKKLVYMENGSQIEGRLYSHQPWWKRGLKNPLVLDDKQLLSVLKFGSLSQAPGNKFLFSKMKAYLCTHARTHTHTTRKLAFKDWPNWTVTNLDKKASSAMACQRNKKHEALDYT